MKSYILKYRLKPETNKVYEINSKTMYRNLLMEVKNSFQYDIDFIYEKEGAFNSYIVKNIKKNFKNLSEKESLLEKVFLEMDEPFSEIVYRISENGEIKQIENIDILRNKWFNKKIEIIKKYEEHKKEVEHYIQGIDQSLNNPKLVYDYFQNFGVNNVFFSGLYGKIYLIDMKKKSKISIPNFLNFFPLPLNLEIIPKKIDPVSDRFF